ncbi:MAG: alpha/beta hydrolase [Clostridia bacterium]|nr:alpha/beta hydrolase [Clostridia bacterium]MBR0357240.1 alpha/beta hydrolase [Clostridia bacterium]
MIRVEKIQIPTLPTKKPRRLYVYTPKGYEQSDERYPVLYMFDGHNVFYDSHATYGKSWGMKAYLEKSRLPIILVAVECNPEGDNRMSEYAPWDIVWRGKRYFEGRGKLTMDWIVNELKPRIDREYRTMPDREDTLIAGSSMGGLMSLYAVTAYNDTFSRAACLSPSLWGARHHEQELKAPLKQPTRVYLDMGTEETDGHVTVLTGLFDAAKLLTRAGATVDARVVEGARHSEAYWEQRIPVFMDYLLK